MRETWEEVGLDLAERDYLYVGQLDDREITTSLGKRLLMILSPHGNVYRELGNIFYYYLRLTAPLFRHLVFLHTSPVCPMPDLQPTEVASAHWVPLSFCAYD
jgi:8-oxo-dGTP pyrophosphatase MutT (NUDIX family)